MMGGLGSWARHPLTVRGSQIAIGVIFAWAGLAKVGDLASFAQQVHNFRLVPVPFENLLTMTLPWVEIVAALGLILGIQARAGGLVTAALMAVFTAAVAAALVRGLDIECGCFGTADASHVGVVKLLENFGMLAVALLASLRPRAAA